MQSDGIFIAIEGVQGANTQLDLLKNYLTKQGLSVIVISFPQYKKASSFFIEQYLQGSYGVTDAYTASLFYALDRFEASRRIQEALSAGKVVLTTNYTCSTMAKQGTQFSHPEERRGFFIWLDNLESQMLKIPRPHQTFVLRPVIDQYTKQQTEVYDDLTQLFPKDFQRIDTVRGDQKVNAKTLHAMIREKVEPLLPERPKQKSVPEASGNDNHYQTINVSLRALQQITNSGVTIVQQKSNLGTQPYFVPTELEGKTLQTYKRTLDEILAQCKKMVAAMREQGIEDVSAATLVLPLAQTTEISVERTNDSLQSFINNTKLPELTKKAVSKPSKKADNQSHSSDFESVRLFNVSPRNELDLVSDILYENSTLSRFEIEQSVQTQNYETRSKTLLEHLADNKHTNVSYGVDVLCSFSVLMELQRALGGGFSVQPISPRFGFAMPESIDTANLGDMYETCFDKSLELFSILQQKSPDNAPYAVLNGHKVRASKVLTLVDLKKLARTHGSPEFTELSRTITEKISEVHPLISDSLQK